MRARFTVLAECDEDGVLVARVPSPKGCHTFADTWEELQERVREVIQLCLEDERLRDTNSKIQV